MFRNVSRGPSVLDAQGILLHLSPRPLLICFQHLHQLYVNCPRICILVYGSVSFSCIEFMTFSAIAKATLPPRDFSLAGNRNHNHPPPTTHNMLEPRQRHIISQGIWLHPLTTIMITMMPIKRMTSVLMTSSCYFFFPFFLDPFSIKKKHTHTLASKNGNFENDTSANHTKVYFFRQAVGAAITSKLFYKEYTWLYFHNSGKRTHWRDCPLSHTDWIRSRYSTLKL